ncbi:MAG: hypothetical protein OXI03_08110 [Chloroflexota bacterium]|nr:hypothetical protein [Chloroflexota bacterium]
MGVKQRVQRPVGGGFPPDFPERLGLFREEAGLSWRSLARLLGVTPYRLREWRRGAVPSGAHLFLLLTLATEMGLRDGILIRPERDLTHGGALRRE